MDTSIPQHFSPDEQAQDKQRVEFHFVIHNAPTTVIEALAANTPFSKQQLKSFLVKGAVWLKDAPQKPDLNVSAGQVETTSSAEKISRVRRAKKLLAVGSEVFFYYDEKVLNETITPPTLIADCQTFSVWYKPKGMLSQGSKWADHTTLARWVEMNASFNGKQRPAIVVHRLDKATDGLMMIAHSQQSAKQITQAFLSRNIDKIYQAGVEGIYPETGDSPQLYDTPLDDKLARSFVRCLQQDETRQRSLVEVKIETGRKHQIRRHLSQAGFPILNDRLYGNGQVHPENHGDLHLTAVRLSITLAEQTYEFALPESLNTTAQSF